MMTALVLVCSLATTPNLADCDRTNAADVMVVPEDFTGPITCYMHGQAYVADISIGQNLPADYRIKVACLPKRGQ